MPKIIFFQLPKLNKYCLGVELDPAHQVIKKLKMDHLWVYTRGGGRCLQGNLWYSPPASMTSRLASATFKMASKVFIEETDKNFDFITEILFRFLGFGDFKVSIVIEN